MNNPSLMSSAHLLHALFITGAKESTTKQEGYKCKEVCRQRGLIIQRISDIETVSTFKSRINSPLI